MQLEELSPAKKKARCLRASLVSTEEKLEKAIDRASKKVPFVDVFNKKKNRSSAGLPFKGIGKEKCLTLIRCGIFMARDLLEHDGGNPLVLGFWKDIVEACYDHLKRDVLILRKKRDERAEDLREELDLQRSIMEVNILLDGATDATTTEADKGADEEPERIIPPFSSIRDP